MNTKYKDCPLYDENDAESAMYSLMRYISGRNKPEFDATNINHETYTDVSLLPDDITKQAINFQYGRNIVLMANYLQVQDYFFSKYMPHFCRYLDILNIDYFFSYFRPSSITAEMIMGILRGKFKPENIESAENWDPDMDWSNMMSPSRVVPIDPNNPTNTFYTVTLSIKGLKSKHEEFYNVMQQSGILETNDEEKTGYAIIKLLPMESPHNLVILRTLFHKYL